MILQDRELIDINGGGISASLLNAFARGIKTVFEVGQAIGSAIRRIQSRKYCSL